MEVLNIENVFLLIVISFFNYFCSYSCQQFIDNTYFKSVPTVIKTFKNDTVLLPCNINGEFKAIQWFHDDKLIIDSDRTDIMPPSHITLFPNGSILVEHLKTSDTGEYKCNMQTDSGLITQEHAIEIKYPPIVYTNPNGTYNANLNTVFDILCETNGIPQPIITWTVGGQPKANNTKRFFVEVNDINLSGPIECRAMNGIGESSTDGIILKVMFPPIVTAINQIVHTKITLKSQLECFVESYPAADLIWLLNGLPLIRNERFKFYEYELLDDGDYYGNSHNNLRKKSTYNYYSIVKHVLQIDNVRDVDLGIYECRATNKLGFTGEAIELTGRPMAIVFKKSLKPLAATSYFLIWETESLSPILEYKLRFQQIPSGNVTPINRMVGDRWHEIVIPSQPFQGEGTLHNMAYEIRGLKSKTVYQADVIARNRYGWSDRKNTIRFGTTGDPDLELPLNSITYTTDIIINNDIDNNNNDDDYSATTSIDFDYIHGYSSSSSSSLSVNSIRIQSYFMIIPQQILLIILMYFMCDLTIN